MRGYTVGLIAVLIFVTQSVEAQVPYSGNSLSCLALVQSKYRAVLCALSREFFEQFGETLRFIPQTDGGGDGGDGAGDGGTGSGGGSDGGASDGTGDAGAESGNGDGPSGDTGTVGDPGDTDDAASNDAQAPADPAAVANPSDPTDIADVPTNDPALGLRGPGSPGGPEAPDDVAFSSPGAILPLPSGGSTLGGGVNVGINAVIVSGAPTPWEAIGKGPGVQNVAVTGGIIALGETALAKPPLGVTVGTAENPPAWLRLKPDFRYLNGSLFPPVVPDVIDIRTISYTEEVIENSSK